jgi:hypothetical protein
MASRKRGNLRLGYAKKDPPQGVNAVDSITVYGKSKGELQPGTVLTPDAQSRFEVHTDSIHRELVGWHWKLLSGTGDRLEAVVEVFNYGDSPVSAYLTRG